MSFDRLREQLAELSPKLYPNFSVEFGDAVMAVEHDRLLDTMTELRELGFDRLGMVTAVDRGDVFVLVYRLHSRALSAGLFVKTQVPRDEATIESVCGVWPAANWQEREVFDLFGIDFTGHPDLRRILLPEDWVGHPLRKDYSDDRLVRRPDYI